MEAKGGFRRDSSVHKLMLLCSGTYITYSLHPYSYRAHGHLYPPQHMTVSYTMLFCCVAVQVLPSAQAPHNAFM